LRFRFSAFPLTRGRTLYVKTSEIVKHEEVSKVCFKSGFENFDQVRVESFELLVPGSPKIKEAIEGWFKF
jgi:hypothetical protein